MADQSKDTKSPWSVTDREFGAIEQELHEVRHDLRNLKHVVDNSGTSYITKQDVVDMRDNQSKLNQNFSDIKDDVSDMKTDIIKLTTMNTEFAHFKTRIYTIFSVVVVLAGLVAWLIDNVLKISSAAGSN
jgi:hypothetical protein